MMDSIQPQPQDDKVYCIGNDTIHPTDSDCLGSDFWHVEAWKAPDWAVMEGGKFGDLKYCRRCGYAESCRCMWCGRCNKVTGNTTQGHFWAFCKVTGTMRDFHFCCPDNCALEETV